ncbi:transmembrane protein 230 [Halyomorpha halys]|uniref:transmembrane protein 230 n=1 Tax=Halyomorpha halys TaxID=286706 RepID=UPI0034D27AD4
MNVQTIKKTEDVNDELLIDDEVICLIPWKGIAMAFSLTSLGLGSLCFGILSALGHLDEKYEDRTIAFFVVGGLTFIPGAYHVFIAYSAYTKKPGYSYSDIPDVDSF